MSINQEIAVTEQFLSQYTEHYIAGTLEYEGQPAEVRYAVIDRNTMALYASGRTKPDGTYKVKLPPSFADKDQVLVIAFDDAGVYNAQVADLINATT